MELNGGADTFGCWTGDPAAMRGALERANLTPWSVHCPAAGWNLADRDEQARLAAVEATRSCLRPSRDLGANLVVCHSNASRGTFLVEDYAASLAQTRRSLEVLAEEADRAGLRLAVETMIPRPDKRPGQRVEEILDLIDGLGEHVGICIDTGHSHAGGADPAKEVIRAGGKLFSVHINDNHGRFNEDEHLLPGQGTINWPAFLAALDRIEFAPPRIFEVKLIEGPDGPRQTLTRLAETVRTWRK